MDAQTQAYRFHNVNRDAGLRLEWNAVTSNQLTDIVKLSGIRFEVIKGAKGGKRVVEEDLGEFYYYELLTMFLKHDPVLWKAVSAIRPQLKQLVSRERKGVS